MKELSTVSNRREHLGTIWQLLSEDPDDIEEWKARMSERFGAEKMVELAKAVKNAAVAVQREAYVSPFPEKLLPTSTFF